MNYLTYILLFIFFFGIHYLEGFGKIDFLPIAQLWKMPILLLLLIGSIGSISSWTKIERRGYLMIAALFFCPAIFTNPQSVIIYASKELPFFLFLRYWFKVGKKKQKILWPILITLAQYICLSSFLTLTGIVESVKVSSDVFYYGSGSVMYYSSVFGGPHPAGSYFCMAIIVMTIAFKNKIFKKKWTIIYNIVLFIIAWYSLYLTFVRTVWLMTILAIIVICVDFKRIKNIRTTVAVLMIMIIGLLYLYENNYAFRVRITGRTTNVVDTEGSGRTVFWRTGISQWSQNDLYGIFFGKGQDKVKKDNLRYNGLAVLSHNQFIDALAQYGLVGFILLIIYYYSIFRFIRAYRRRSNYYKMCMAMFISTMMFAFFQNEMYFIYAAMFSLAISIMYYGGERVVVVQTKQE